jgi:exodeoxyribonuclease V alpha subunit
METVKGIVEDVRVYNGGWSIAFVRPGIKVVGHLASLSPGDLCAFQGTWKDHPRYGRQFQAKHVFVEAPKDEMGIRKYLARHFDWIGPATAEKLTAVFGEDLFRVMKEEPERLSGIPGITQERIESIHARFLEIEAEREADMFFASHGITLRMVEKLVEQYGSKDAACRIVKENPYRLAEDVWGIGFRKADDIALSIGIERDFGRRIWAGVNWTLREAEGDGHCFLPKHELLDRAEKALAVDRSAVLKVIQAEVRERDAAICVDDVGNVSLKALHQAERCAAERLKALLARPAEKVMQNVTQAMLEEMDPDQQRALHLALQSRMTVITGGPGVGKTYTIKRILEAFGDNTRIELAAPTGKAAKRMAEMTGRPAQTLHRLLEFVPEVGFTRNKDNPIESEVIIVDESSMIDVRLMQAFMDAVPDDGRVIFVGDVDQLPSVGPGRVLGDMIDSGIVPTARLQTLHRQAQKSLINRNAQRINKGENILLQNSDGGDFWFIPEGDAGNIPGVVESVIRSVPKKFGFTLDEIQVLCPQKKGPIGTQEMNKRLGSVFNPHGAIIKGTGFRDGDRVIQLRNNYKLGVFNGDIGVVAGANDSHLFIDFDDIKGPRRVEYPRQSIDELALAFALTVHKSQGSEFPVVIVPLHTTNWIMLSRNLLYTAVTRGKELVVLVGTQQAIRTAIRTVDSHKRFTKLKGLLRDEHA